MPIDIVTISLCGALVILALASPFFNVMFRVRRLANDAGKNGNAPTLSVILAVHDNAAELERNLPAILTQDYKPGYEVIIVNEASTDDTEDVLKRLKNRFPNLYITFVPDSSHYLSRRKLALTIGMKAAHNEWVVITNADCRPQSDKWLKAMASHCDDNHDMVLGYTKFDRSASSFQRYERVLSICHALLEAQQHTAYRYNGNNIAVRKSTFMAHNGFLGNLKFLRGEYDFMVNEYALPHRAAIAMSPEAHVVQDKPTRKKWLADHLFYMETRRHLRRSLSHRLLFNADTLLLHANYVTVIAAIVYASLTACWLLLGVSLASLAATLLLRATIASKAMKHIGEEIPAWCVLPMELRVVWQNLYFMLRHFFSDKQNFIRK